MALIEPEAYLQLRVRFRESGEIDGELYAVLHRLTAAMIFGGRLAPAYSPIARWDAEAHLDALHDWIERRLLRTNALLAAFDIAENPRPFLYSLERSFHHHLENAKERGELDNLISRAAALMRDEEAFHDHVPGSRPSEVWWGLSTWDSPEPYQGSDPDLVAAAWALGHQPIFRYSPSVGRASPVLSTETLRSFLVGLFERVGRLLTLAHLAQVFSARFDLGPPRETGVDVVPDPAVETDEISSEAITEAATSLVAELTNRQTEAILRRYQGETLEEIAGALGVSRGTADNALRAAGPLIDKHCADGITRELLLEKVLDALSIASDKERD